MFDLFVRNWWVVAIRGLCALLFGVATIVWPGVTLTTLVLLFGGFAVADGILALIGLLDRQPAARRWVLGLHGIVSVVTGILTLVWPGITALVLLYMIVAWAILIGILTIVAAIELRKAIDGEWLLGLSGAAALLFGVGIAVYPGAGILALLNMIAAYAIIAGVMQIALGLRLRRLNVTRRQIA